MSRDPKDLIRLSEAEADRLARLYMAAEREILILLDRAMARGNDLRYLRSMLDNVQAILEDLFTGNRQWCEQAIPRVYIEAARFADELVGKAVGGFGAVHQQAVKVLADNTFERLESVRQVIGRRSEDLYRQYALETTRQSIIGYKSVKQVSSEFRDKLRAEGITGFTDARGRDWNMKSYAEMVARTTTMEAHLTGTANRLLEHGYDLVVVSSHAGSCAKCAPWQGRVLSLTGKTPGYPTLEEAREAGLFHPNCFPAGVLVSGPAPLAAFARWYEGEIVVITTASGVELPVTPNHPILTPKGWIAAGLLNEGDNIIRYTGQKGMMNSIDPDYQDVPTPIEQVVDAFGKSSSVSARSMPISSEDFHGDGVGSKVYVVWTNGLLMNDRDSFFEEPSGEDSLGFANMRTHFFLALGAIAQFLERGFVFPAGLVSGLDNSLTFGCRCVGHAAFHDCRSRDARSEFAKPFAHSSGVYTELISELLLSCSSLITLDKIINLRRSKFAGHIYNLQTKNGWYVANSIITHNCRHAYSLYIDLDAEIEGLEREEPIEVEEMVFDRGTFRTYKNIRQGS